MFLSLRDILIFKPFTMKVRILVAATLLLSITSCKTLTQTATDKDINGAVFTATTAELDVSDQKVTYTLRPSARVRRGGMQNCINVAIQEALKPSKGDVLIETQQAIVTRSGFLRRKIKSVTVSGYPAKYKEFKPMDSKVIEEAYKNGAISDKNLVKTKVSFFNRFK